MPKKSLLLQLTGDLPLFTILDFLVEHKGLDFSKTDIVQGANISRASLFKYWPVLEEHGMVKTTRQFGKTKLFTLNSSSPIVKKVLSLEKTLIEESLRKEYAIAK